MPTNSDTQDNHEVYSVFVKGEMKPILQRKETHEHALHNRGSDNYWIDINGEMVPFIPRDAHRPAFEFRVRQENGYKHKWGGYRLTKSVVATIIANGKSVYEFHTRDMDYALAKCQVLAAEMTEHSFDFFDLQSNNNRKVWYYEQPGLIKPDYYHNGRLSIIYDGDEEGFDLDRPWWIRNPIEDDWHMKKEVHTDVFDSNIYWFRD